MSFPQKSIEILNKNIKIVKKICKTNHELPVYSLSSASYADASSGNDFFDSNGNTINQEELTISMQYDQFFEIPRMTVDKISEELHISRRSVIYAKESLLAKSYTRKNEYDKLCVYIDEGLLVGGYFEIRFAGKLNGGALIFYSFLLDKCERYFFKAKKECTYCIDTYRYKLASEFGESEDSIKMFLRQIYDKKLAKRLKNKKLQLYLTPQEND